MLNAEEPGIGAPGEPGDANGLACLTEGIQAYLQEIGGYRAVCRRHEGTTTVDMHEGELRVARCFENSGETVAHLTSAVRLLPGLPGSAAGGRSGNDGTVRHGGSAARKAGRHDPPCIVRRDIVWEGRRLLVHACLRPSSGVLRVDLCVFRWESDLPELPLRTVATALRCHEFLVPDGVALPLPVPAEEGQGLGVRDYLTRAMPPNLLAGQCI